MKHSSSISYTNGAICNGFVRLLRLILHQECIVKSLYLSEKSQLFDLLQRFMWRNSTVILMVVDGDFRALINLCRHIEDLTAHSKGCPCHVVVKIEFMRMKPNI